MVFYILNDCQNCVKRDECHDKEKYCEDILNFSKNLEDHASEDSMLEVGIKCKYFVLETQFWKKSDFDRKEV